MCSNVLLTFMCLYERSGCEDTDSAKRAARRDKLGGGRAELRSAKRAHYAALNGHIREQSGGRDGRNECLVWPSDWDLACLQKHLGYCACPL